MFISHSLLIEYIRDRRTGSIAGMLLGMCITYGGDRTTQWYMSKLAQLDGRPLAEIEYWNEIGKMLLPCCIKEAEVYRAKKNARPVDVDKLQACHLCHRKFKDHAPAPNRPTTHVLLCGVDKIGKLVGDVKRKRR